MSIQAIHWAFNQNVYTKGKEKLVLIALANYANEDGFCYPSISNLCEKVSAKRDTICRALCYLIEHKYIEKTDEFTLPKKYKSNQNVYKLLVVSSNQSENVTSPNINASSQNMGHNQSENGVLSSPNIQLNTSCKQKEPSFNNKYSAHESLDDSLHQLFQKFLELRKSLKAKNSDLAIKLLINELVKHSLSDQKQMIENSIMNSWKSIYPISKTKNSSPGNDPFQRKSFNSEYYSLNSQPEEIKEYLKSNRSSF